MKVESTRRPASTVMKTEVTRYGGGDGYALVGQWGGGGGVNSLTTVDLRKGRWNGFSLSVCVCVWLFSGMRVSAN